MRDGGFAVGRACVVVMDVGAGVQRVGSSRSTRRQVGPEPGPNS
jgi:hypothetical protein